MRNTSTNLFALLPSASFVPFTCYRATRSKVCWKNNYVSDFIRIEDYAFYLPAENELSFVDSACKRTFYAERYGGAGLGQHGGGVRCGYDGIAQVKGIGMNPLVGTTRNFFHSYGGASKSEGVLEAIWGEVCNIALPFGGVRVHGLLETGSSVPVKFPKSGGSKFTARVLIVREPALRPGHFMRAIFYKSKIRGLVSDSARVLASISQFERSVAFELNKASVQKIGLHQNKESIDILLEAMCFRFASQLASARAKRIMHGSITASNICVDGRWIDFASISALSDYGRIKIPRGAPDFTSEHLFFRSILEDLAFYLRKFGTSKNKCRSPAELWTTFADIFEKQLFLEFIELSGVPLEILERVDEGLLITFYEILKEIMRSGNGKAFSILSVDNDYMPTMPKIMGSYHLPSILSVAAFAIDEEDLWRKLEGILPDAPLRLRLVSTFIELRNRCLGTFEEFDRAKVRAFFAINCYRRNVLFPELYRTNLYPHIEDSVLTGGCLDKLINSIVFKAKTLLSPLNRDAFIADYWFGCRSSVGYRQGFIIDGVQLPANMAISMLDSNSFGSQQKAMLAAYVK